MIVGFESVIMIKSFEKYLYIEREYFFFTNINLADLSFENS